MVTMMMMIKNALNNFYEWNSL